jgi:hypothetical protein
VAHLGDLSGPEGGTPTNGRSLAIAWANAGAGKSAFVSDVIRDFARNPAVQQTWQDANRQLLDSPALRQLMADSAARQWQTMAEALAPTTQRMVEQMARIITETNAATWRELLLPRDLDLDFPRTFAQVDVEQVEQQATRVAADPEIQATVAENPGLIEDGPAGDAAKRGDWTLAALLFMITLLAIVVVLGVAIDERLNAPLTLLVGCLGLAIGVIQIYASQNKRDGHGETGPR